MNKTCPNCGEKDPVTVRVQPTNKTVDEYYCKDCLSDSVSSSILKLIEKYGGELQRISAASKIKKLKVAVKGMEPVYTKNRH